LEPELLVCKDPDDELTLLLFESESEELSFIEELSALT
jgi:hypothetical protein